MVCNYQIIIYPLTCQSGLKISHVRQLDTQMVNNTCASVMVTAKTSKQSFDITIGSIIDQG